MGEDLKLPACPKERLNNALDVAKGRGLIKQKSLSYRRLKKTYNELSKCLFNNTTPASDFVKLVREQELYDRNVFNDFADNNGNMRRIDISDFDINELGWKCIPGDKYGSQPFSW